VSSHNAMGDGAHFAKSLADLMASARATQRRDTNDQADVARPISRRRCLVSAARSTSGSPWMPKKKTKPAYAFTLRSGEPFASWHFDAWKEPDGGLLQSFAIITTDPTSDRDGSSTPNAGDPQTIDYDRWLTPTTPNAHLLTAAPLRRRGDDGIPRRPSRRQRPQQ